MDVWIKSPVDVLITGKYPTGPFKLCLLMVIAMMQLYLGGIFNGDFTTAMFYCFPQFQV